MALGAPAPAMMVLDWSEGLRFVGQDMVLLFLFDDRFLLEKVKKDE